ncbi:MAG: hypothetical protein ABJN35_07040 [Erythrobacter sp.]
MTRKQFCALASVTALFVLAGLAVWKLSYASAEPSGSATTIITSSIVLYLMYLFSVSSERNKKWSAGAVAVIASKPC